MTARSHWGALFALVTPHRARLAGVIAVLAVAGALPLAGPLLIAEFIDRAGADAATSTLIGLALVYVAVGVARQVMSIVVAYTSSDLAWTVTNELRSSLTHHVLDLDLSFHRGTSPGELVSRVDHDVTVVSEFIAFFAVRAAAAAVTLIGLVAVVATRDWRIALGLSVYLALAVGVLYALRDRAVDEAATEQAATGRMLGEIEERLTGADDLRGNGGGSHAVATFQVASARVLRASLLRERNGVTLWIASNAVFVLGGLVVIAVDAALLRNGTITLGTAYLLFQSTQLLRGPLEQLADETERVQRAAGGMRRTLDLLAVSSALDDGTEAMPQGALSLEFDSVTFAYDDEDPPVAVIDDVSFRLEAGTTVGVLGRTGSGKTTMARLVLRLVDPTAGAVRLSGVDLRDARLAELRGRTGVVAQDVHLFSASIRDNLTLFDPEVDDEVVLDALGRLELLDWLGGLPDGLDTVLGPGGGGLSAGEAQLVALTRLFLRSPDFVLLDEASSRVDPVTERRVTRAVDHLFEDRTAFVIAHRLSTVERLDRILIVDGGRIVEYGPTDELRADPSSQFARLLAAGSGQLVDEVTA